MIDNASYGLSTAAEFAQAFSGTEPQDYDSAISEETVDISLTRKQGRNYVIGHMWFSLPKTMTLLTKLWQNRGLIEHFYIVQGYKELSCSEYTFYRACAQRR